MSKFEEMMSDPANLELMAKMAKIEAKNTGVYPAQDRDPRKVIRNTEAQKILDYLKENRECMAQSVADGLRMKPRQVYNHLHRVRRLAEEQGYVLKFEDVRTKATVKRKYILEEAQGDV